MSRNARFCNPWLIINWMKCSCGWSLLNSASQLLEELESTASKRVLILRTWSLIRTFLAFWVLIGSLFIFQGPYFHYFGFIHVKNVNSATLCTKSWINHMRHITCSLKPSFAHENCLIFAGIGSGLHCYQFLIFTYAYALIFIHRCFGSLFRLLGSLFHKKMGSHWVLISKLGGPH